MLVHRSWVAASTCRGVHPCQGPAKSRFVPICPMAPRRGPALRYRVGPGREPDSSDRHVGHLVHIATLPGPWGDLSPMLGTRDPVAVSSARVISVALTESPRQADMNADSHETSHRRPALGLQ